MAFRAAPATLERTGMTRNAAHICLVTPGHLATNPRLVKEADALVAHGYRVTCVSARFVEWADVADEEFETRAWARRRIAFGLLAGRLTWLRQGIVRRVAALADRWHLPARAFWRERAFHPVTGDLIAAASAVRADLYIGHNLAGLIAAGHAARRHGALLGFDAEVDHVGELPDDATHAHERAMRDAIHRRWLPACRHLTAASPMMADALARRYDRRFVPIHNVFAPMPTPRTARAERSVPTLYWFSQTVGPGRGLELIIPIMAAARTRLKLAMRGRCDESYPIALRSLAQAHGLPADVLEFLPPVAPGELTATCDIADLGLSIELGDVDNRRVCLGNKIFQFLAGGLPVLLSRTPAQAVLSVQLGDAALLIDLDARDATAAALDAWFEDPATRERARAVAVDAAATRWNWAIEQHGFLDSVARALGDAAATHENPPVAARASP
jgi:glycosyltransferase involved in cell wall biosynthesis